MMNLLFCGDIMPGGVLAYQGGYMSSELQEYMHSFDFRIGTLEAAIGTNLPFDPVKMEGRKNIIYARNEDFFRVKEMGFDVVSLANNHVWDLGEEGLKNTIKLLDDNGIKHCGAGMNLEEASRPAVIEKDGLRIALFAYCMFGNKYLGYVELAKNNKAGVSPLTIETVKADILKAKQAYDKVIVLPHWGREYLCEPLPECIWMAKQMIAAGADAVIGSHPHQVQPLVFFKGKPVCFSLGNFLFPDFFMYPPRPIWYPNYIDEVRDVEDVVGYPFPIDKPLRQVWNPTSRYGYIMEVKVDTSSMGIDIHSVHLAADNIEYLSEMPPRIQRQLNKAVQIINNPLVRKFVYVRRKVRGFVKLYIK